MYNSAKLPTYCLFSIFVIITIFAVIYGERIGSYDGVEYYVYLRSFVFDRDVDFENDYALLGNPPPATAFPLTVTGRKQNHMSVGPAILWSPFFLLAHAIVLLLNLFGAKIPANGISGMYTNFVLLGSVLYSFAAFYLIYLFCQKYYAKWIAFISVISIWLGSFMIYYTIFEPFYSHTTSLFAITIFIYYWNATRNKSRTIAQWCMLGVFSGIMILVRWQNGIFMLIPALESILEYYQSLKRKNQTAFLHLLKGNLAFLLIVAVLSLPQLIVWKILYGNYFVVPQGKFFVQWDKPNIPEIFFASRNGLFSWSPITLFATFGFFLFYKRDKTLMCYLLLGYLAMSYVNSAVGQWWGGGGYGARRFDSIIPIFALGLAAGLETTGKWFNRKFWIVSGILLAGLMYWNLWFMREFRLCRIPHGESVRLTEIFARKVWKPIQYFGYPFSFPANYIFSIKYDVPPSYYDIVVGKYLDFLDGSLNGTIEFYSIDKEFLKSGWADPQYYYDIPVRWSIGSESSLFVYLYEPKTYLVKIHVIPFYYPDSPEQSVQVIVNKKSVTTLKLANQWQEYVFDIPREVWRRGVNVIQFKYGYTAVPKQVLQDSADDRPLAVCWHYMFFLPK
ncbi:MAG: glycosyltransferase family 39 protein [bacterium]|nr:glycosyltransferase family 39 protein [bacterium]